MDDDITLKRCPFCGSYPIHEDIGGINYYRYHIFCDKCGAAMPYEHIDEIAISRWNSRVKMEGENTMNKKELENEIPEELTFEVGEKYDYVDSDGGICWTCYTHTSLDDIDRVRYHRAFRTERLARIFADKTQFIADLLYFKDLYDRDYEPDWNSENERSFFVYYNGKTKKYEWSYVTGYSHIIESVYFSTKELAERCVNWLNKRNKD